MLQSQRLDLIPCAPAHLLTLIETPDRFAEAAGFSAADELRGMFVSADVSPAWLTMLRTGGEADPWRHGFFLVQRESRTAIGTAGFKGPPDESGTVEIAYGVAPSFRGQGYATEAAAALFAFACDHPHAKLVRAHTLPTTNASTRVLAKNGFRDVGGVVDPDDGLVWRWEREVAGDVV
jgi:RimJ/RimL family protein N-acetyltransferase